MIDIIPDMQRMAALEQRLDRHERIMEKATEIIDAALNEIAELRQRLDRHERIMTEHMELTHKIVAALRNADLWPPHEAQQDVDDERQG